MAAVLVDGVEIQCLHGGKAKITPSQTALKVGGKAAILKTDLEKALITGCGLTPKPCAKMDTITAGVSTVLKVNGTPVMLASVQGKTDQEPILLLSNGQTVLDSK